SDLEKDILIFKTKDIMESIAVVFFSDLIVTVDTAIVHIADCFEKDMITLYNNRENDNIEYYKYNIIAWGSKIIRQ
ncbi:MAG: hypothetical protein K5622_03455, partial [Endomicrobiaceae bacterium]|nr:hypothetical protein [Endomicrobiaceae bacterium]